jgi:hypothetical protein
MLTNSIVAVLAAILIISISMTGFPTTSVTAELVTGNNDITNVTSILDATTIF